MRERERESYLLGHSLNGHDHWPKLGVWNFFWISPVSARPILGHLSGAFPGSWNGNGVAES